MTGIDKDRKKMLTTTQFIKRVRKALGTAEANDRWSLDIEPADDETPLEEGLRRTWESIAG